MKKLGMYATVLIALYLVVDNGGKASKVTASLGTSGAGIIDAFQGR